MCWYKLLWPYLIIENQHFGCLTEWLRLCTSVTAVVAGKTAKMQGEAAYTSDERETVRFHEL